MATPAFPNYPVYPEYDAIFDDSYEYDDFRDSPVSGLFSVTIGAVFGFLFGVFIVWIF